ncbi:MAG: hypothetical protein ABIS35_13175 [Terracoccus sp.]
MAAVAATVAATVGLAACLNTDAADQKVIDRLTRLDVLTVPPRGSELSRTSAKGGGNQAIRTPSTATVVYATTRAPAEVGQDFHSRFDSTWRFVDNPGGPLGGWQGSGALVSDPGTVANVLARRVTPSDKAPGGSQSVVTVTVSATRPA